MEINIWFVFLSGIAIGYSPCILLILSVFGSSLIISENKSKILRISLGLISGMLLAYVIISILFIYLIHIFDLLFYFRSIFAAVLIFIGSWQILEYKQENSRIFGTPKKVKSILKDFIERDSGIYAFLIGIIFTIIKIPCFGGVYLSLLYNVYSNPLLLIYIISYLTGLVVPIILILILIRFGLESNRIDEFRLKYRKYLRILNGAILITFAIILLFI